jgi:ABC-type multidrug transport system ATPase subunit
MIRVSEDVENHKEDVRSSFDDWMIRAIDLEKIHKGNSGVNVNAVAKNTFGVKKGSVVGLLGPNGAGKSSTFNILSLTESRSSGEV